MSSLSALPVDVLRAITQLVGDATMAACARTCRALRAVVGDGVERGRRYERALCGTLVDGKFNALRLSDGAGDVRVNVSYHRDTWLHSNQCLPHIVVNVTAIDMGVIDRFHTVYQETLRMRCIAFLDGSVAGRSMVNSTRDILYDGQWRVTAAVPYSAIHSGSDAPVRGAMWTYVGAHYDGVTTTTFTVHHVCFEPRHAATMELLVCASALLAACADAPYSAWLAAIATAKK